MTYSTDPVEDAARYWDSHFAEADAAAQAEEALANDFLAAARKCDANGLATWAPMVTDWQTLMLVGSLPANKQAPKRYQLMHECMAESLDYTAGPDKSELMQLLLNVAYGDSAQAPAQARALLKRMANTFATNNVGI